MSTTSISRLWSLQSRDSDELQLPTSAGVGPRKVECGQHAKPTQLYAECRGLDDAHVGDHDNGGDRQHGEGVRCTGDQA